MRDIIINDETRWFDSVFSQLLHAFDAYYGNISYSWFTPTESRKKWDSLASDSMEKLVPLYDERRFISNVLTKFDFFEMSLFNKLHLVSEQMQIIYRINRIGTFFIESAALNNLNANVIIYI